MKTEYTNQLQRDMGGGLGGTPIKTASTILFEYGIDIMKMDDDFNSQLLFAIERYAEQFKPTPSPSTVDFEREAEEKYPAPQTDTGYELYTVWEATDLERKAYIKGRKVSLQERSDGWVNCENRLPTIEDCGERNKKVAARPHHSDADIEFVYYYNVHRNRHSHWHPINFQLQTTSQEGLRELVEWVRNESKTRQTAIDLFSSGEIITKATELLNKQLK